MPPIRRHGSCPGAFRASQQHRTCVKSSSRASFRKKEVPGVAFFGDGQRRRSLSPSFKGVALTMELRPRYKRWVTKMAKKLRPLEPRNLALAADLELEGARRVEAPAIFVGQSAELRARDYYDAIERGALNTRIADAQIVTPKTALSFAQKRRRPVR